MKKPIPAKPKKPIVEGQLDEGQITEEEKYKKRKNLRNLLIKLFGMIFKRTRVLNLFY